MMVNVGSTMPNATFMEMTNEGPVEVSASNLFSGRKVVLFGVPGAFTPVCHKNHLPGFLDNINAFKDKGVDEIMVVAVNDVFVIGAWADATDGENKIRFLADGNAEFSRTIGMDIDLSVAALGVRSKRYSMMVDDGEIKILNVEDVPSQADKSGAAMLLSQL